MRRGFEGWKQDMIDTKGPIGDVAVGVQAFGADAASAATSVGLGVVALSQLKLGALAARGASLLGAAATGVATAAQWAYNAALSANPIGLIVLGIAALVAGLVWFFTKTELGQKIVAVAWLGIKAAIAGVTDWWQNTAWPIIKVTWDLVARAFSAGKEKVGRFMTGALEVIKRVWSWSPLGLVIGNWDKITGAFSRGKENVGRFLNGALDVIKRVWGWSPLGLIINNWSKIAGFFRAAPGRIASYLGSLPGRIAGVVSGIWDPLWAGFRGAMNSIVSAWNNFSLTIGGGSIAGVSLPSVTLYTPNIPYLAQGGDVQRPGLAVVGDAGPELLELPRGARVTPLNDANTNAREKVQINITNHYPQAEPTSVTQNRGLQYAASLGVI